MDSVIIFFGNATHEEVEREASTYGFRNGTVATRSEDFFLWRYSEDSINAENESKELLALRNVLGCEIKSAFQVAARHGESASPPRYRYVFCSACAKFMS
jgi:hypothetical protein